ncbi:MAG: hypothetical protein DRR04_10310, partial [Gammaproteobacteria bacterium]
MANQLTTLKLALPASIAKGFAAESADDLSQGVSAGFGILSYRGKVWRVKYKGVETVVMNAEGDPAASISVVLLKANPALSKTYYAGAYVEGDDTPPACSSANGVRPDTGIKAPQSPQCDVCPQNVWGSKITPQGTETKACSDARRISIVPAADMVNEACGGAMLLRIPAASLSTLAAYSDMLKQNSAPYYGVVTKVGFDPEASYPKLTFTALRGITDSEAPVVLEQRDGSVTKRILEEEASTTAAAEAKKPAAEETIVDPDDEAEAEVALAAAKAVRAKAVAAKAAAAAEDDEAANAATVAKDAKAIKAKKAKAARAKAKAAAAAAEAAAAEAEAE